MPYSAIAEETGIDRATVKKYIAEMKNSVTDGPVIHLKPAQNYHEYVYFLEVEDPLLLYVDLKQCTAVVSVEVGFGSWNLLVISNESIDYTELEGYEKCILHGIKGTTFLSRVITLDWNESMERMNSMLNTPQEKSSLYEEIPVIPWRDWEWDLYHRFKDDARILRAPISHELGISSEQWRRWLSSLFDVAHIQTAFYPLRADNSCTPGFLFKSEYQEEVVTILGMLPATSTFFSVGEYLLARLFVTSAEEMNGLMCFMQELERAELAAAVCYSMLFIPSEKDLER